MLSLSILQDTPYIQEWQDIPNGIRKKDYGNYELYLTDPKALGERLYGYNQDTPEIEVLLGDFSVYS